MPHDATTTPPPRGRDTRRYVAALIALVAACAVSQAPNASHPAVPGGAAAGAAMDRPESARLGAAHDQARADDAAEEARLVELAAHAEFPQLTRAQMYADFDTLVATITAVSPQAEVRAAVTGIDPVQELGAVRREIEAVRSIEDFALVIKRATTVFQDGHTSLFRGRFGDQPMPRASLAALGLSDAAVALAERYTQLLADRDARRKLVLPLRYIAGDYYTVAAFDAAGQHVPAASRLTHANGMPVHAFVRALYSDIRMLHWDFARRRYYSATFYLADQFSADDNLTLQFAPPAGPPVTARLRLGDPIAGTPAVARDTRRVEWLDGPGVLYIRMPVMDLTDAGYYPDAIEAAARGHRIRKVVFDIRGNGGGGDGVWRAALAAVIDQPIELTTTVAFRPLPALLEQFGDAVAPGPALALLGHGLRAVTDRDVISPAPRSIRTAAPIYVIQDDAIFSSAGAFAAVAAASDRVVSVGARTGRLLGAGVNPLVFELPHSRMLFRVEPVIDVTRVTSAADAYHDTAELPVETTLAAEIAYHEHAGDRYSPPFLEALDPVFRAVIADPAR